MRFTKLSLALASLLLLGIERTTFAQEKPGPIDVNQISAEAAAAAKKGQVTFTVKSMEPLATSGSSRSFNVNFATGAYTVESSPGGGSQMITLESSGVLTKAQLQSLQKSLDTVKSSDLPKQLPGAIIDGAGEFTISWDQGGKSGAVSGVDNPKAAVEGQSASVKKLWGDVTPLFDSMQKLETKLVADHPFRAPIETLEGNADAKKGPKPVDLGLLASPGTEFEPAAAKAGLVADGGLFLQPGQEITFETDRNQINGIASMKSNSPDVTITSKVVKAMVPGQDGNMQRVQWTIKLSPKAGPATAAEITAAGDYMSRNDPKYNFHIGVAAQAAPRVPGPALDKIDDGMAPPSKDGPNLAAETIAAAARAAAKAGTTVEGGSGIRQTIDRPNTGINQVLDRDVSGDEGAKADKR